MYTVNNDSLQSIADSIRKKAKTTEKMTFPDGFVSAIDGIETGGGSAPVVVEEPEEKAVNFYDYDGRRLFSYTAEEAAALTELPTPPGHEGLVFQEWNYTLDEVKENSDAADIGALYTTDDGATRIHIEIPYDGYELTFRFYPYSNGTVELNWGDDSAAERPNNIPDGIKHTYAKAGRYVISLMPDNGKKFALGSSQGGSVIIGSRAIISEVNCGNGVDSLRGAFSALYSSIGSISLCNEIKTIGDSTFYYCEKLKFISFPHNVAIPFSCLSNSAISNVSHSPRVTTISSQAFNGCHNLRRVVVGCGVSEVETSLFAFDYSLLSIVFKGNISWIKSGAFQYCKALKQISFTKCKQIPTLASASALDGTSSDLEILVPVALAEEWKAATNWTKYANNIKGV